MGRAERSCEIGAAPAAAVGFERQFNPPVGEEQERRFDLGKDIGAGARLGRHAQLLPDLVAMGLDECHKAVRSIQPAAKKWLKSCDV